jgi:hypothetical protein
MFSKQLRFIIYHSIVMGNLQGREVSINEAGSDWSVSLAIKYRVQN